MAFYLFHQNNSGGYYMQGNGVDEHVIIEAASVDEANALADALGLFDLSYCECCGVRFSELWDDEDGYETPDEALASSWSAKWGRNSTVVYYRCDPGLLPSGVCLPDVVSE